MVGKYEYINPFEIEDVTILQQKLIECQKALKWALYGEQLYARWTHRLLENGYEGAEKIREKLTNERNN